MRGDFFRSVNSIGRGAAGDHGEAHTYRPASTEALRDFRSVLQVWLDRGPDVKKLQMQPFDSEVD